MKIIIRVSVYLFPIVVLLSRYCPHRSPLPSLGLIIPWWLDPCVQYPRLFDYCAIQPDREWPLRQALGKPVGCAFPVVILRSLLHRCLANNPFSLSQTYRINAGSGLTNIISWVGLFINGFINFVIPLLFYICALRRYGGFEPVGREQILHGLSGHALPINLNEGEEASPSIGALKLHVDSIQERAPTHLDEQECLCSDEEDEEEAMRIANPALFARIEADLRFRTVPKSVARWLPPIWIAGSLSVLITVGIVATIIMDMVYLAQGDDVVS